MGGTIKTLLEFNHYPRTGTESFTMPMPSQWARTRTIEILLNVSWALLIQYFHFPHFIVIAVMFSVLLLVIRAKI